MVGLEDEEQNKKKRGGLYLLTLEDVEFFCVG